MKRIEAKIAKNDININWASISYPRSIKYPLRTGPIAELKTITAKPTVLIEAKFFVPKNSGKKVPYTTE